MLQRISRTLGSVVLLSGAVMTAGLGAPAVWATPSQQEAPRTPDQQEAPRTPDKQEAPRTPDQQEAPRAPVDRS